MDLPIERIKKLFHKDKRKSDRLALPITLYYTVDRESASPRWTGPIFTNDVSGGGLHFFTKEKMKNGDILSLKLQLPGMSDAIRVNAEVVWCRKDSPLAKDEYAVGVEFSKMKNEDRQKYVNFICEKILTTYLSAEGLIKP